MTPLISGIIGFNPGILGSAEGHAFGNTLFAFTSIPPDIDGDIQDTEWTSAAKQDIVMSNSESDIPGTIYVMNDANNLYIALEIDSSIDAKLQIRFDDNHDGLLDLEEDVFSYDPISPANFDSFIGSVEEFSDLVEYDDMNGGALDGVVGASEDTLTNYYEFSHPLCSSDITHDFCLTSGNTVGFSILYFIQETEPATWPLGVTEASDASSFADVVITEPPASAEISIRDFKPDRGLGSTYDQGDSITLLLEVENVGSQDIQQNCMTINVGAFFPDQNVFFDHDDANLTPISPTDIETFAYDFQIPTNASSGWYDIVASVSLKGESCGGPDEEEISHTEAFNVDVTCSLPEATVVTEADNLPDNYYTIAFSSSEIGVKSLPDPILPVTSIFVGTNTSEGSGLIFSFTSDGLDYSCPILHPMNSIEFSDNHIITNVQMESVGGLANSAQSIAAYVNYVNHKFTQLPVGTSISVNDSTPSEIHEINFDRDSPRTIAVSLPAYSDVKGIWVAASEVQEPHLYFRAFGDWFASPIEASSGTLLTFEGETNLSEVVVAIDDVLDRGNITIGYIYPIQLKANAGSDQVVVELQRVYLDGTRSQGPEIGMTYLWKQTAGPTVIVNNANTAIANFVSPAGTAGNTELDFRFQLTLRDTMGNVDTDTIVITLQPGGQSPVVFAGYDTTIDSGSRFILNGLVWDSDNKLSDVTIRWIQISGIPVVLQNATTISPSFIAPVLPASEVQDLEFELSAEDINENTATANVTIHVIGKETESTQLPTTPPPSTTPTTPPPSTTPTTPPPSTTPTTPPPSTTPTTPPPSTTPTTPPPASASSVAGKADFGAANFLVLPIAEFADDNPTLFIAMATVIPSGIVVAVVAGLRHRVSSRSDALLNVKAAKVLFPHSDPVADEYEATRPFIEALEKELGTKLDTATSISDLLEKFSGKKQIDSG
jgi:K319-like protein